MCVAQKNEMDSADPKNTEAEYIPDIRISSVPTHSSQIVKVKEP
jgi:hypothetical protein